MRVAAASSVASSMTPLSRARETSGSFTPELEGISRSSPAASPTTRSFVAVQSDITTPSKPQSSRRISVSSLRLSQQYSPFTRLYAAITDSGRDSSTAISNPRR